MNLMLNSQYQPIIDAALFMMSAEVEVNLKSHLSDDAKEENENGSKVVVEYVESVLDEHVGKDFASNPFDKDPPILLKEIDSSIDEASCLEDDEELEAICENYIKEQRKEVVTPKCTKELKQLLALSKEANLDVNLKGRRKSIEPNRAELMRRSKSRERTRSTMSQGSDLRESEASYSNYDDIREVKEKIKETPNSKYKKVIGGAVDQNGRRNLKAINDFITMNNQKKDSFCWQCHHDGVNVFCIPCPRSYHQKCLKQGVSQPSCWMCPECSLILQAENVKQRSLTMQDMTLEHLGILLKFALKRMLQVAGCEPFLHPVKDDDFPEYKNYIVHPMDITCLERNIKKKVYGSPQAFETDAKWILHNSIIFNSCMLNVKIVFYITIIFLDQSKLTSIAKSMLKICKQEMIEIENCATCYLNANTKKRTWFIEVCPKPHVLVWAKLKGNTGIYKFKAKLIFTGFPYWPAKAMRTNSLGMVDVRFFGAHDRAWIHHKDCYLFSLKDPNSNKQKKNEIIESVKELQQHVENLKRVYGEFRYAPYRLQFELEDQSKHIQLMLPNYPNKIKDKRSLSRLSKTNGSVNSCEELDSRTRENTNDFDKDDDETLENHKRSSYSRDENIIDKVSQNESDSGSESQSSLNHTMQGNVKMHGGVNNVSDKIKILPKVNTPDNERKRFSTDEFHTPSKMMRCSSYESDISLQSNSPEKINKLDITENMEISIVNKSVSSVSTSEGEISNLEVGTESKRKSVIQVSFGLNENSEISISPQTKTNIVDHLIKRFSEPDDVDTQAEGKKDEVIDANDILKETDTETDILLGSLRNKGLTILEKVTELSPDTDIFETAEGSNENEYTSVCSGEIESDNKNNRSVEQDTNEIASVSNNNNSSEGDVERDTGNKEAADSSDLYKTTDKSSDTSVEQCNMQVEALKDSVVISTATDNNMVTDVSANKDHTTEEVHILGESICDPCDSREIESIENSNVQTNLNVTSKTDGSSQENDESADRRNTANLKSLKRTHIRIINVDDIKKMNLEKDISTQMLNNSQSILENRLNILDSRRQSSCSEMQNECLFEVKSEPSSEDEPSDSEYLEKKRKYLSALNISEIMPKKPKTNEIRTRSKTEDRKFKIADNLSKVIDDVATHYSLNHANDDINLIRTPKKKEISIKPLATLQDVKQRARKSFPSVKNVYPSQKKDTVKICKATVTPISSVRSSNTTTALTNKPIDVSSANSIVVLAQTSSGSFASTSTTATLLPPNQPITYTGVAKPFFTITSIPNNFYIPAIPNESQNYIPQSGSLSKAISTVTRTPTVTTSNTVPTLTNITPFPIVNATPLIEPIILNNVGEDIPAISRLITEPLARSLSEIINHAPPKLKPRPPGALSTQFSEGIPSSAGNVTNKVNSISHRLNDYFRGMLIELLKEMGNSANPEAEITRLKLENEELKHRHAEEILEIKKNIFSILKDLQRSTSDEKNREIEETRANCEIETVKRVEEAKSKQWCANCSKEAQFYCCWNTSYCDYPCQQKNWPIHMSKCTQQIQNSQLASTSTTSTTTIKTTQQPIVLRQTSPPKGYKTKIIGKPTKVLLNRPTINKVPLSFARTAVTNQLTLVESTPGTYELVGNSGPISVGGKLIANIAKLKPGAVLVSSSNTDLVTGGTKNSVSQIRPILATCVPSISTEGKSEVFCCLKSCLNGIGFSPAVPHTPRENPIQLDTAFMGYEVVIVKGGQRVCGAGAALGNAPLVQSKSYFEVKIQQAGSWAIGLATRQTDLSLTQGGMDQFSWALGSDHVVRHNKQDLYRIGVSGSNGNSINSVAPQEGDLVGVSYDHIQLKFYVNGEEIEFPVVNVKGTVYPALYVDDGAILDIIFENFNNTPPSGFEKIMLEQSLL
ncbi:hypothetical protein FQA39_LY13071 [Lamprigera yunnana]|nr:hypothetical protein FQA39_LY13071 [Lamprigera yunnana]